MDYEKVAREFLVALRAHRSQTQFSRWLGYRSNVVYTWEAGRRWPTGAETLRACSKARVDVVAALERFYGRRPAWLDEHEPWTQEGVACLLDDLRGSTSITELAKASELSRYSVSRWLAGQTQPRLPDFLRIIEAASQRLLDLLAALVDPAKVPSITGAWEALERRREGAGRMPWTQAVLCAMELATYRALPAHEPGWIADRLGLSAEEEARCLAFLRDTGQAVWTGTHFEPATVAVDTAARPELGLQLKAHWAQVAAERVAAGSPGQFSYNVFGIRRDDFERVRQMHLDYFRAMRALVAESEPPEVVAVVNVQLFSLEL